MAALTAAAASPAVALAGTTRSFHEADEAGRWALLFAFGALGLLSLVLVLSGGDLLRGMFLGQDRRLSTSKTTAVVWTYLLAGALLSIVFAKLFWDQSQAYDTSLSAPLDARYGLLIGGPLGAAILAKQIVTGQVSSGATTKPPPPDGARLSDLVSNDTRSTDLGDLQYVLFNVVAIVFFLGLLLESGHAGLPMLPDTLLELTSVSAVGYVGKKALVPGGSSAQVLARAAAAGDLTIVGTGLLTGGPPQVLFGSVPAPIGAADTVNGRDVITVTVPPRGAEPAEVDIVVLAPPNKRISAGRFAW